MSERRWLEQSRSALKQAVRTLDVDYEELGVCLLRTQIDFVVKDVIGREWLGTVQVDYNLPERFDISYVVSIIKIIDQS